MEIQQLTPLNIMSGIYSPFNRFNGSVVFCRNLYEAIIDEGCNVNFVGLQTDDAMETNMNLTLLNGSLTGEVNTPPFNNAVDNLVTAFQKILLENKIDIIHGHHLTFPPAAAFGKMKFDQPFVITSHASDIEFAQNNPAHGEHMKRSLERADKVVLLSRKLIPLIEQIKPDMSFDKIAIIPLGVDEKFFAEEKIVREHDKFTILYSGRLTKEKGVEILLEGLKELPRASLRIAGMGVYGNMLKERVKELHLEDRVTFLGFLDRENLKKEYQQASVLAVPSQGIEGIPQVSLEAMSNYLPVVATDTGGTAEVVNSAAIVVPKEDHRGFIDSLIKLYKEPSLREELALKGRERAEEYRWNKIAKLYLSLFRSLL